MYFGWFDAAFGLLFPLVFLLVLGVIVYTVIGNLHTWNKNNHSPRLAVAAAVVSAGAAADSAGLLEQPASADTASAVAINAAIILFFMLLPPSTFK